MSQNTEQLLVNEHAIGVNHLSHYRFKTRELETSIKLERSMATQGLPIVSKLDYVGHCCASGNWKP